jgi:hypothetical protein
MSLIRVLGFFALVEEKMVGSRRWLVVRALVDERASVAALGAHGVGLHPYDPYDPYERAGTEARFVNVRRRFVGKLSRIPCDRKRWRDGGGDSSEPSHGLKPCIDAQASISLPSTEK